MSELRDIVEITIDRQTQTVSQAGFGTPAIIAEFATDKTVLAFDRYRDYGSIDEMTDDGWLSSDAVYQAAAAIFSQNPRPDTVKVGRIDKADANLTASLAAVAAVNDDWYTFAVLPNQDSKVIFDADFVTANSIVFTINGTAVTAVPFDTDQATTMAALETQIEADIANSVVTIDPLDTTSRTLLITVDGYPANTVSVVVTGGASQPGSTIYTGHSLITEQNIKDAAAWAETQKKLFGFTSDQADIKNPALDTDIFSFLKAQGYDRTFMCFHTSPNGADAPEWMETAWPGECLPFDPGSQTWAYKTLAGVAVYPLTSGERTAILNKNGNIYTLTGGVNITEQGKVASGEYIDIMRGLDWLEARIQEAIFGQLVANRKIGFTDEGIALVENALKGVLALAEGQGVLTPGLTTTTVPKAVDVPTAEKAARNLPDVKFEAVLQGAIHTVVVKGTVSL